ncbi:MAG TPA: DUF4399 domain-containing protein [Acidimicrobiales bacterium]|nr:DUF4399 domain-containing protein [Acidimicrobiales bacterium]
MTSRLRLFLVALLLLSMGAACGDDKPSADDLKAEAKEQTADAAEKAKQAAEDAADKGKEVAEDVGDGPDSGKPALDIVSPAQGTKVAGNTVDLKLTVRGITIVKADGNTSGESGHFHVFIDREPNAVGQAIPNEPGIVHSAENPIKLSGLGVGRHTLTVVLGDGAHHRMLGDVKSSVSVDVAGPSVDASAPTKVTSGQDVVLEMKVQGVTLVKADGDRSGATGHLHVFVDRDPTASGSPIPQDSSIIHTTETTVRIPGLAAGEHTFWVVVGDGAHVPLDPPVRDRVVVTVT